MCNEIDLSQWELNPYKAGTTGFVRITCKVLEELQKQATEESMEALNHIFENGVSLAQIGKNDADEMVIRIELNNDGGSISMKLTKPKEKENAP